LFEKAPERKNGAPKTYFRAEDPEYLSKILEREQKTTNERSQALKEILPELGKLYLSSGERPRVRFFEGIEGVKTMLAETLKPKKREGEILSILSLDEVLKIFPNILEEYTPERVRRGIRSKVIYSYSGGPILNNADKAMLRESRFIPKTKLPFAGDLNIDDNEVTISVIRGLKPFGVILESKEIADSLRAVFNLAWEASAENH